MLVCQAWAGPGPELACRSLSSCVAAKLAFPPVHALCPGAHAQQAQQKMPVEGTRNSLLSLALLESAACHEATPRGS